MLKVKKINIKQKRIVEFIYKYTAVRKIPPTLYDLYRFFHFFNLIRTTNVINSLEKDGYLDVTKNDKKIAPRSIKLTDKAYEDFGIVNIDKLKRNIFYVPVYDNFFQVENKEKNVNRIMLDADFYFNNLDSLPIIDKSNLFLYKTDIDLSKENNIIKGDYILVHRQNRTSLNNLVLVKTDNADFVVKKYTSDLGNEKVVVGVIISLIRI